MWIIKGAGKKNIHVSEMKFLRYVGS